MKETTTWEITFQRIPNIPFITIPLSIKGGSIEVPTYETIKEILLKEKMKKVLEEL